MSAARVFVARLTGCSVFDPAGDRIGRARDVVVVYRRSESPAVVGIVVEVPGKRRVFLSIGRISSIGAGQIIAGEAPNPRKFEQRGGEVRVIAELLGKHVELADGSGPATIEDVAIERTAPGEWTVTELFLRRPRTGTTRLGKGPTQFAAWQQVKERETDESQSAEHLIATYSDLQAADLAQNLLDLPEERRLEVAGELPDERLADALEEMDEQDQAALISQLDEEHAADVLDQMEPDDAADLIAQLPEDKAESLLGRMEPEEAEDVRFLLSYAPDTAGGLMTTEPIIVSQDSTVAEGLALIRRHELDPSLAAAIFVTLPPYETPTGRFLGVVHFQRMLRYPPNERLGTLLDPALEPLHPDTSAAEVSRRLASYNLVSLPVVDDLHRLLGVVTIDDVLDYLLPDDWRSSGGAEDSAPTLSTASIPTRGRRASHGTR